MSDASTQEMIQAGMELLVAYGLRVVGAIVLLLVGRMVAGALRKGVRSAMTRRKVDETLIPFASGIVYYLALAVVLIAVLGLFGIETTSLIAVLGAAGLAVGLALQGSLSNFAAGVLIVAFRPYKVGDYVEAGGVSGTVEEVQIFTTVLKSPDNKKIIVPNSQIMAAEIVNYSAKDTRRVDLVAGCGYDDDLDKVRRVLNEIVTGDDRVLQDPAPTIAVLELADSSVNFVVRPWTKTEDYWGVYFDTMAAVKLRLDEEGIEIPFPQTDVHLHPVGGEGEAA